MDAGSIAAIIVALVAAIASRASNRAASKASTSTALIESRSDMERDAYARARQFDMDTIKRQDEELKILRRRVDELEETEARNKSEIQQLRQEVQTLRGPPRDHS